jgi:DNA-binding response OmpR family regulator
MTIRLLVAEDAPDIAQVIAYSARMIWPGCQVGIAENGSDAMSQFLAEEPDLVVLDVQMPPPDGLEVCRRIRAVSQVPILMLTVRDTMVDKVKAFDLGADDYLTKPFDPLELQARLRALARRAEVTTATAEEQFTCGDLTIDFATREVRVADQVVQLTPTEYRLLEELVRHAGTALPNDILLERVWGPEWIGDPGYIKVFVRRLRKKLGDDVKNPRYVETVRGVGYRLPSPR